jgi:galactokinase
MAQAAEHSPFVGVNCGIMDQFISANAEQGHALMLDCHDLSFQLAPLDPSQATIVIINSMKKRGLVDSEYNKRRSECEEGLSEIRRLSGKHFETIRHIPMDVFGDLAPRLEEGPRKRLRHNITENARVHDFRDALTRGDLPHAGFLLYEGHQSLARDYEVSCAELDTIVDIASRVDGVLGCRMTGAGFGGCAVALVRPPAVEEFQGIMDCEYNDATGKHPEFVVTTPAAGASALSI